MPVERRADDAQPAEVQDADAEQFAAKLQGVFRECHRILKDDGLLVFTYHHSRDEGWKALAEAVLGAGFAVVNSQPVKAEMSVATPKSQAKEPIQLDIIIVCRKEGVLESRRPTVNQALESARAKLGRLLCSGVRAVAERSQDRGAWPAPDDAAISRGGGTRPSAFGYRTQRGHGTEIERPGIVIRLISSATARTPVTTGS